MRRSLLVDGGARRMRPPARFALPSLPLAAEWIRGWLLVARTARPLAIPPPPAWKPSEF